MTEINVFQPIKVSPELYTYCRRQTIELYTAERYKKIVEMAEERQLSIDGCATEIVCRRLAKDPHYEEFCGIAETLLGVLPKAHFHGDPLREKERVPQQRKSRKSNRIAASLSVPINTIALNLAYAYGVSLKIYLEKLVIDEIKGGIAVSPKRLHQITRQKRKRITEIKKGNFTCVSEEALRDAENALNLLASQINDASVI